APPQPTGVTATPSHGPGGQNFSVHVTFDKPIGFDGLTLPLHYDGVAYGPGSVGGSWGQTSCDQTIATTTIYGASHTVHIPGLGSRETASGIYIVDPSPVSLTQIYYGSGAVGGGGADEVWAALDHPAPPGGATVTLQSGNPSLLPVPPSITVPVGQQYWNV